jgi:hypothetical protein
LEALASTELTVMEKVVSRVPGGSVAEPDQITEWSLRRPSIASTTPWSLGAATTGIAWLWNGAVSSSRRDPVVVFRLTCTKAAESKSAWVTPSPRWIRADKAIDFGFVGLSQDTSMASATRDSDILLMAKTSPLTR